MSEPSTPTVFLPSIPSRYIPNLGKRVPIYDVSPAAEFGALELIVDYDGALEDLSMETKITLVKSSIRNKHQPLDYLVAIGDPVLIGVAIHCIIEKHGKATVLRWDRQTETYQLIGVQ